MRSADITEGGHYYCPDSAHEAQRVEVLSPPAGGYVRTRVVDGITGEPVNHEQHGSYEGNTPTRDLACSWEAIADAWNERNDALMAGEGAASQLDAALHQLGVDAKRVTYGHSNSVTVHLVPSDAARLAELLACIPRGQG